MGNGKRQHRKVAFLLHENGPASAAVLGGKGAGLVEMVRKGVPVPPAFTVTTSVARAYSQHGTLPRRLSWQLDWGISGLERQTGKVFGGKHNPLLVSVRSGAAVSMPGMMDTVLNLGLNPDIVSGLGRLSGPRFAWDSYRRFLAAFGQTVLGVDREYFEMVLGQVKERRGARTDEELDVGALKEACNRFRLLTADLTGQPVADCPRQQLELSIAAVLRSWDNPRARTYRQVHGIPHHLGTAVNIQAMVFGNRDADSGTGVVFSRNCATGEAGLWGEFLPQAQGEDIVSGSRTPLPISALSASHPLIYQQLASIVSELEAERGKVVDVEFTFESGRLFILQVRGAKLTPEAAITVAVHGVWDGKSSKQEALELTTAEQVDAVKRAGFEPSALEQARRERLLANGLPASPGAAVGRVATTCQAAVKLASEGVSVVLVRPDTSPDDLPGMLAASAIVTGNGGATSHAAVVARGLGKPAVVGCSMLSVTDGDTVSVDGSCGVVLAGAVPLCEPARKKELSLFLRWHAESESRKWPKPRLDFATIEKSMTAGRLLNDFYLCDAMARAAAMTALQSEAEQLRKRVHVAVAEHIATYLVLAVCGELRYARESWRTHIPAMEALLSEYKIFALEGRGVAQGATMSILQTMSTVQHARFLQLAACVFDQGWPEATSIGGVRWGNIARAAQAFLEGKLPHSLFADHAFDLQHNNGSVFGKHQMLERGLGKTLLNQLEAKKEVSDLNQLFARLDELQSEWLPEVVSLYRKGERAGIWKTADSARAGRSASTGRMPLLLARVKSGKSQAGKKA